jgi:glutathione S-transferase
MVIYYKGIEDEVEIKSPVTLGGLKSPEYLILNPHGKMPLLVTEDSVAIPESDTIARYLMDRFSDMGPTLLGGSLLERTLSNAIARHHDVYIGAIQGCLYKPTPPFGVFSNRQVRC